MGGVVQSALPHWIEGNYMTVEISPNIKKESQRVNLQGVITDPKTKQVIGDLNDVGYTPTPEERQGLAAKVDVPQAKPIMSTGSSELDAKINEKVELYRKQLIEKAKEALDNLWLLLFVAP